MNIQTVYKNKQRVAVVHSDGAVIADVCSALDRLISVPG